MLRFLKGVPRLRTVLAEPTLNKTKIEKIRIWKKKTKNRQAKICTILQNVRNKFKCVRNYSKNEWVKCVLKGRDRLIIKDKNHYQIL